MAKNREFLMLAHKYDPKRTVGGWWASEKLDGMRAYWDGGVTRGTPKQLVPWANHDKDERYVEPPICTGLWSRYGNVIHAPDWWLDKLPFAPLDGELYIPEFRQELMKIVKKIDGSGDWSNVKFYVFDSPPFEMVLGDGRIYNNSYKKIFENVDLPDTSELEYVPKPTYTLRDRYRHMSRYGNEIVIPHDQVQLAYDQKHAEQMIAEMTHQIVGQGGEGLIIRDPDTWYECKRVHSLLKVKPTDDMEGTIVGYTSGRKTDLGSKHLGRMGALIVMLPSGKLMELSGFTDAEREFACDECANYAADHPGEQMPQWVTNPHFPIGRVVTFKFRGFTADGIPQEARYMRDA